MATQQTVPTIPPTSQAEAPVVPQPTVPEVPPTPPDGFSAFEKRADGTYYTKLVTGEEFSGTPDEILTRFGKSKVETTNWARSLQQAQPPTPAAPVLTPEQQQQEQLADYVLNILAPKLGAANAQELVHTFQQQSMTSEEARGQMTAQAFMAQCPEFPATPQASQMLLGYLERSGIVRGNEQPTVEQLKAGHAACVMYGVYKPLTQEEIRASLQQTPQPSIRPTPAPIVPGTQPENPNPNAAANPWSMPMADLRKLVKGQ